MNDYERRQMLLHQSERKSSSYVAPRYEKKSQEQEKSTLWFRIMVCIVCFICYVMCDYGKISFHDVDSKMVFAEIGKQTEFDDVWNLEDLR